MYFLYPSSNTSKSKNEQNREIKHLSPRKINFAFKAAKYLKIKGSLSK
jgi:hypothetical protein